MISKKLRYQKFLDGVVSSFQFCLPENTPDNGSRKNVPQNQITLPMYMLLNLHLLWTKFLEHNIHIDFLDTNFNDAVSPNSNAQK